MKMRETVTITKVILPRRRFEILSRQRLLDLLENLLEYRLILVTAPAGYGKTSLLIDLAHQVDYPVCWLALDTLDQSIHRFLLHFIAAIQYQFPEFGENSFAVLQSAQQTDMKLDHLVTSIVNEIYEHVSEHFVVVLDDYHLVAESEDVKTFINRFVQEMDENCHLAIASRVMVNLPDLSLLVGRSQVMGLSFDELAFLPGEIKLLIQRNYDQPISDEEADNLANETEGWITSLLLTAEMQWKGITDQVRVARVSGVDLYDYLAQQVLDQQSQPVRDFLLRSSLLEEFNAEMCQSVLGQAPNGKSWSHFIENILNSNLFVQPVESDGTWLRYHHLFRDFLQKQLSKEQPHVEDRILRRLLEEYKERLEWEKAYEVCNRLADEADIIDFIKSAGIPLIANGRYSILAKWIDDLPTEVLSSNPALLAQRGGVAMRQGEIEHGLSLLNQAEQHLPAGDHNLAQALVWRAFAYCKRGKYQQALNDANRSLEIISRIENQQSTHAEALEVKGECFYFMGHPEQGLAHIEFALEIFSALDDQENMAYANMAIGYMMTGSGQYRRAIKYFLNALDNNRQTNNPVRHSEIILNIGFAFHIQGDLIQAHANYFETLKIVGQIGYEPYAARALANLGSIYAELSLIEAALEMYRQARIVAQNAEQRHTICEIGLWESERLRSNLMVEHAKRSMDAVEKIAKETESVEIKGLWALEMGCLCITEEETAMAIEYFEDSVGYLEATGLNPEIAKPHLYLAFVHHMAGNGDRVIRHLRAASQAASKIDNLYWLLLAGRETKGMLKEASAWPEVGEFATRLIDTIEQFDQDLPRLRRLIRQQEDNNLQSPPCLDIQAFGGPRVELNGKPVTSPEWANQKKVRELFCLLLENPAGLTKEAIGDALWPDSNPHLLPKQFNNAIYRLRKALGKESVSYNQRLSCYQFNRRMDYRYDVENFKSKYEHARDAKDSKAKITAYKDAIEIYRGPYLPKADGTWVLPIREELRRMYFEAIMIIAEFYFQEAQYEQTREYCKKILLEDPCYEAAHCMVMRVHAALGNRSEIVQQFQRCKHNLRLHIDVKPSPETVTLFKQLVGE